MVILSNRPPLILNPLFNNLGSAHDIGVLMYFSNRVASILHSFLHRTYRKGLQTKITALTSYVIRPC